MFHILLHLMPAKRPSTLRAMTLKIVYLIFSEQPAHNTLSRPEMTRGPPPVHQQSTKSSTTSDFCYVIEVGQK